MYSLKVYWFLAKLGKNLELKTAREFDSAISLRKRIKINVLCRLILPVSISMAP